MLLRTSSQITSKGAGLTEILNFVKNITGSRQTYANFNTIKCWKCGAQKSTTLFCEKCNVLQEPEKDSTYYDVIGMDKTYDIKLDELTKKFKKMQSILHPDRFGNKEKEELAVSENFSALVNEAYTTLQSPLQRGLYLLKLEGLSIEEGTLQSDPAFLMEMMELNEELAEASDTETILRIAKANQDILNSLTKQINDAFEKKDLQGAKALLVKMKYYWSLEEKIKETKQKFGIVM